MLSYILRRLVLVVPTLFGIMLINFALTQFVPGGPIDQIEARLEGNGDVLEALGGGSETEAQSSQDQPGQDKSKGGYIGARGLPPDFRAKLEVEFGFARWLCPPGFTGVQKAPDCTKQAIPAWERFSIMMGRFLRFDFGDSYFKSQSVVSLIIDRLPVSITLGLWTTLIAYAISIPLGIRKAVRDGSAFDNWSSAVIIAAYSIPSLLFAVLLLVLFAGGSYWQLFPLRGLVSDNWAELSAIGKVLDYFWHIALPVTAMTISSFATMTLLTKNSFLEEIKKQYVMTARAKGLTERRVLYGHVFRNAMLIVIAGFPSLFISVFFGGSIIIENIFSLDGLGRLGYEAALQRDYPVIFGTLFAFGLIGLVVGILSDLMYVWVDPRIDFEARK